MADGPNASDGHTAEEPRPMLADLFEGFFSERIKTSGAKIFLRRGGEGPPLLLLHGFPQTHVMWHRIAPVLAERFMLIIPDLRGYGWSSIPPSDPDHIAYSKRTMAHDMVEVMAALGHQRFAVLGHDRGARVGYRMALDHPERVERLAVLDIVPTYAMWRFMTIPLAMRTYHWMFLAQPAPLPETLLAAAATPWLDMTLASWTANKDLRAFDERALAHYRACFQGIDRMRAVCEDYRAGWSVDQKHDAQNWMTAEFIACPTLAVWGREGFPAQLDDPAKLWREWGGDVETAEVEGGHFLPEENPQATLDALLPFLTKPASEG